MGQETALWHRVKAGAPNGPRPADAVPSHPQTAGPAASDSPFQAAIDEHPDAIGVVADGRFVYVNRRLCELAERPAEELLGAPPATLPIECEGVGLERLLDLEAPPHRQRGVLRQIQKRTPVEVDLRPISAAGRPARLMIVRDVSAQEETEEQLHRLRDELAHVARQISLGEMATSLAHELNQPLAALAVYADSIQHHLDQPTPALDDARQELRLLSEQVLRAGEVIRRIREFARKRSGRRSTLDVNDVIGEILPLIEAEGRLRRMPLRLALDPHLPHVQVDRIQLQQVLLNLVRNAWDAMDEVPLGQREVTITTHDRQGLVEIAVRDRGRGLPPGKQEEIFKPFFTTKRTGLGLGLSISRTLIESHGGRLWVSPNPDRGGLGRRQDGGVTFYVSLPATSRMDVHPAD
ncbi:MAG: PAS domain S-box protein [Planctomycetia bacterium]|nr:PAS domain S-box protein [Planctomycetia bacterium]